MRCRPTCRSVAVIIRNAREKQLGATFNNGFGDADFVSKVKFGVDSRYNVRCECGTIANASACDGLLDANVFGARVAATKRQSAAGGFRLASGERFSTLRNG